MWNHWCESLVIFIGAGSHLVSLLACVKKSDWSFHVSNLLVSFALCPWHCCKAVLICQEQRAQQSILCLPHLSSSHGSANVLLNISSLLHPPWPEMHLEKAPWSCPRYTKRTLRPCARCFPYKPVKVRIWLGSLSLFPPREVLRHLFSGYY